ncbi:hypothetical protein [Mesobacillus jeotgali]|uniref:hypothetical protein n=1 Tax=Mesobacillus jeotgali TaxID=129985 RepID=UPI0009A63B8C|nr:hypothetical protein [Mesobacillus jeotgali]
MDNFQINSLRNYFLQENMHDIARLVDTGTDLNTVGELLLQRLLQEDQIYQDLLRRMGEMDQAARAAYEQILQIKEEQIMFHPAYQFLNRLITYENQEVMEDCGCNGPSGQADSSQTAKLRDDGHSSEAGQTARVEMNQDIKASNTAGNATSLSFSKAGGTVRTKNQKRR